MSKVALVRCESYDESEVEAAVRRGVGLLGGVSQFMKPGEKLLLKPNWIVAAPPEKCATTHPSVFRAAVRLFTETGACLTYGDSPGRHSPELAARETGFRSVADEFGLELADFKNGRETRFKVGGAEKTYTFSNGVLDADGVVSLPKLKTQMFLKLTGAVKNQFGYIPGMLKSRYHGTLPEPADFARMLVDVNLFKKPRLFIMDGIVGMDGNGPMNGDPIKMNVLLFSADPVALDAAVCRIIDLEPEYSFTITEGEKAGLGSYHNIEFAGDPIESFRAPQFNISREPVVNFNVSSPPGSSHNNFMPKPYILEELCKKCGVCIQMCPVESKAVNWRNGDRDKPPAHDYETCIRCFCCQELCPEGAIKIR
jgi:uncharacterized protein (DUF362 family)/Pyruvate/2-oxoacid:ferredoxin oxidoreductase delta subunit